MIDPNFHSSQVGLPQRRREINHHGGMTAAERAAAELALRQLSRNNLIPYIMRRNPVFNPGMFHIIVADALQRFSENIAAGNSPRLIIMAPPRHGKSELVSANFPSYHLGRYPDHEVIACSYGSSLALEFSRKNRDALRDEDGYRTLFPDVALDPNSQSLESWNIGGHAGGYVAAGIGGPITGKGMNCGIIDDYVKNMQEAESKSTRDSLYAWYESTFLTRLAPGGGVIIMATRWHEDDLIGRVLRDYGGEDWEILRFPAIAEEDDYYDGELWRSKGEALHPERYPVESLKMFQRNPRVWNALYQQRPSADEGDYFKRYSTYKGAPYWQDMYTIVTADLAIGKNDTANETVFAIGAVDRGMKAYALDQLAGRWSSDEIVDKIIEIYREYHPDAWGFEHGQISMAIGPFLARRLLDERIYDLDVKDPEIMLKTGRADKSARARPLQGMMNTGMILFPEDATWWKIYWERQFKVFPNSSEDDSVDAWAWFGQMVDRWIEKGMPPPPKKDKAIDRYGHLRLADALAQMRRTPGRSGGGFMGA